MSSLEQAILAEYMTCTRLVENQMPAHQQQRLIRACQPELLAGSNSNDAEIHTA